MNSHFLKPFLVAQLFVAILASSMIAADRDLHNFRDLKQVVTTEIDKRLVGKTAADAPIFTVRNDDQRIYRRNLSGILAGVDLTAISVWNSEPGGINYQKTCTLVAPDVAIGANHSCPPNGTWVRFIDNKNGVVTLIVDSSQRIATTDIQVIKFTTPAPPRIKPAKILLKETELNLGPGLYLDRDFNVHVGDLNMQKSQVFMTSPRESNRVQFWTPAVQGDSGHPIFALVDGQFALISTLHWATGGDNLRQNITAINAAMTSLWSAYQLTPFDSSAPPQRPVRTRTR